jgi:hypothetical protein
MEQGSAFSSHLSESLYQEALRHSAQGQVPEAIWDYYLHLTDELLGSVPPATTARDLRLLVAIISLSQERQGVHTLKELLAAQGGKR